jgi:uncharacterized repeat protein (TIGR01451 family)
MVMAFMQVSGKEISVVSSPKENHPSENIFTVTVTTEPSNCPNNGTATVTTSEPGDYVYHIISGPAGFTLPNLQNHGNFTGLKIGNYVVKVSSVLSGDFVDKAFSIIGTPYVLMNPTATALTPTCIGTNGGKITITVPVSQGVGPFQYELIDPSPVVRPPQESNVFDNLPPGNYVYRVYDSCGEYQQRVIIIPEASGGEYSHSGVVDWLGCSESTSTFRISINVSPEWGSVHKYPYTIAYSINGVAQTPIVILSGNNGGTHTRTFEMSGNYNSTFQYVITNGCSVQNNSGVVTISSKINLGPTRTLNCSSAVYSAFHNDVANPTVNNPFPPTASITYELIRVSDNAVIATQIGNPYFTSGLAGVQYKIRATYGSCMSMLTNQFNWIAPAAPSISAVLTGSPNWVGTASRYISLNNKSSKTHVWLSAGPASHTLLNGQVINLTYPMTLSDDFGYGYYQAFPPGNYTINFQDECGNSGSKNFTVLQSETRQPVTITSQYSSGCSNNGTLTYTYSNNASGRIHLTKLSGGVGFTNQNITITGTSGQGQITNIPAGEYKMEYEYTLGATYAGIPPFNGVAADRFEVGRFVIHDYVQTSFVVSLSICVNNKRNIAVVPEPGTGVAPYKYRIISGPSYPEGTPLQNSPEFLNLDPGTYVILVEDECGNGVTRTVNVDDFQVPPVNTVGSTCENQSATFYYPDSPYFTYEWTLPNGLGTHVGPSLTLNAPITPNHQGQYSVKIISNVGGACSSEHTVNYNLTLCQNLLNPNFTIEKTSNIDSYTVAGQQIEYTIKVENVGAINLSNVTVTDPLVGLNQTIPSLAVNDIHTINRTYTVLQSDIDNHRIITNTAKASVFYNSTTYEKTDTVEVDPPALNPSLALVKAGTFSDTDADGFAKAGEKIAYSFTVHNTGNTTLTNIRITDPLIIGLTNYIITPSTLIPGAKGTASANYTLTYQDIKNKKVINTASVTGTDPTNANIVDISGTSTNNDNPTEIILNTRSYLMTNKMIRQKVK